MRKPVYRIQIGNPKPAPIIHHNGRDYNIWATADGKVLPGDLLDRTGL